MNVLAFIALVLAVVAMRRASRLQELVERVERLEAELRALRGGAVATPVAALAGGAPAAADGADARTTALPAAVDVAIASEAGGPFGATPAGRGVGEHPPGGVFGEPAPADLFDVPPPAGPFGEPPPAGVFGEPPPAGGEPGAPGTGGPGDTPPPGGEAEPPAQIDWERWIGVRGAAVLGGAVLALAGLFFFNYAIEHGLIPPWLRVVLGVLTGCACLGLAEWTLRRDYAGTANAIGGAGLVILYSAFWAAANRYGLIGTGTLFALLCLVTAAGSALSWRHRSQVMAVMALVGGFLTPLFASSGADRPIGLFAYVLLLDGGLLWLARRRGWPLLAGLAVLGTTAWQAVWIVARMGPDRLWIGLVVVAMFAAVFALAAPRDTAESRRPWRLAQAAGVLLPFAFALYFATQAHLDVGILQLGALLVLLGLAAGWLARVHGTPSLALGAASASVAVVAAWALDRRMSTGLAWQLTSVSAGLAAVFHAFVELEPERPAFDGPTPAALVVAVGFFLLLGVIAAFAPEAVVFWPWLAGGLALAVLLLRHGGFAAREPVQLAGAILLALFLAAYAAAHEHGAGMPAPPVFLATLVALAIGFQQLAMRRAEERPRRFGEQAATLFALVVMGLAVAPADGPPLLVLATASVLGFLALLSATRLGGGPWVLAAMGVTALVHSSWTADRSGSAGGGLAIQAATMLVFTAWPFLASPRLRDDRWSWRASALAAPAWFLSLGDLFESVFGDTAIGILPLALGAVTLVAAQRARAVFAADDPARTSQLAWFLGVTTAFVTVAIPLQLEKEWITIGWALEGVALLVLWRRLDHPGLKWIGVALLAVVTVRLVGNEAVLGYYPRSGWRVLNWLLYTYLVPAAALLGASTILAQDELPRLREWERPWYVREIPLGAIVTGCGGLLVIFVWINLAIFDWFATGETLAIALDRQPARDLAMSIAWAAYALGLLALGVRRASVGLRWISLGLLMVTIVKVFLYDLGELRDLYRVASLLGLAVSLIVVSLAYQRFVLRRAPEPK